jgi:hypothetical protein
MTTMHGNNSTNPSGTEIDELPFSRMRLRKNDNRGRVRPFPPFKSSSVGMVGVEGIRLIIPCMKSMAEAWFSMSVRRIERFDLRSRSKHSYMFNKVGRADEDQLS